MLAFLILAGVATAVAAPVLMSGSEASVEGDDEAPESSEEGRATGDLLDMLDEGATGDPGKSELADSSFPEAAEVGESPASDEAAGAIEDLSEIVTQAPAAGLDLIPLKPEAGETPDQPPDDILDGPVLAATDPDAPDIPPDDLVDAPLLAPTPGDAPEDVPLAAPGLFAHTFAPDLFDLDPDPDEAEAERYEPVAPLKVGAVKIGHDMVRLTLETSLPPEEVVVDVRPSADGTDGIVTANGRVVAILEGAPDARPEDIEIELENPRMSG